MLIKFSSPWRRKKLRVLEAGGRRAAVLHVSPQHHQTPPLPPQTPPLPPPPHRRHPCPQPRRLPSGLLHLSPLRPHESLRELRPVQTSAARMVTKTPSRHHPVLQQLHRLPVTHRIDYTLLLFTWPSTTSSLPDLLHISSSIHLSVPPALLSTMGAEPSVAPQLWNP
ncbi:hypothetical protein N1851_005981 [Merluccius polli]|uniref:Uncharacterized protein n=1 Tax=Merluccius polli TaxID=89951 RepID=A0AA47P680_MERPO|nr:hypothetical protein N1851_005981 [Merluccius polli]